MSDLKEDQKEKVPYKAIAAGSIGNVVEWVDWAIYGLAAPFIASQFFPAGNATAAILQTYVVFFIGFLIRPIGAIVLGAYGDTHGRNQSLFWAIILMALGTGLIGCLPTYAQIGIWAPILLTLCRLIQGFAAGGEFGTASSFLYEYAPKSRKNFFTSFRAIGTGLGTFIGGAILSTVTFSLAPEIMAVWGWRIAFWVGAIIGLVGIYIRTQVDETPEYQKIKANNEVSKTPIKDLFKYDQRTFWTVTGMVIIPNVAFYVILVYMSSYFMSVLHLPSSTSTQIISTTTIIYTCMVAIFGFLGDYFNLRYMVAIGCAGFVIATYPVFSIFINTGTYSLIIIGMCILAACLALYVATFTVVLAEQFPTRTRNTAVSATNTLAATVFGGTAPFVATYLISVTNTPMALVYYLMASSAISFLCVLKLKDTAADVRRRESVQSQLVCK